MSPALIAEIRELYKMRQDLVRMDTAIQNRTKAVCRRLVGFSTFDEDAKRAKSRLAESQVLHRAAMRGDVEHEKAELARLVLGPMEASREPIRKQRAALDRKLSELAMKLPVWEWCESVRGFGALSLAQLVGETGDLSCYANPAKLWKRMGLACGADLGGRQRRVSDADAALLHGYSPTRRSIIWNIGASMIRSKGQYYELYLERKEVEAEKEGVKTKAHAHNRAKRWMEKRFLLHLWREWQRSNGSL